MGCWGRKSATTDPPVHQRITDGQTILLQRRPEYVPAEVSAIDHINLNIRADDIQQVTAYLRANGADLIREAAEGGDTVRVHDPDRNVIEIRIVRGAEAPGRRTRQLEGA